MSVHSTDAIAVCPVLGANPVFDGYFADPFVFSHQGVYYAVGTGKVPATGRALEFPLLRSTDFVLWELVGGALLRPDDVPRRYWAPEVVESEGVFYMYYSVGTGDERHELRVATSLTPEGPYTELGAPVLDPSTASFAIDPSPFQDDDGHWYLFYARDFLDSVDGNRPGTAIVVAPLLGMVLVPSDFTVVMRAHHDWQRYEANRPIYGGVYDWHTLEGPCVLKHEGKYYCLYSGGNWQNDSYGVDFCTANNPLGPWTDTNPGTGPRILKSIPGHLIGPGHNSALLDPTGAQCIAYHAWDFAMKNRQFCIDPLVWTDDGPALGR